MKPIYKIKLNVKDIDEFLKITESLPNDINLAQDYIVVSGKSLLGLYRLDFGKRIDLIIRDVSKDEEYIIDKFKKWIID